VRKRKPKTGALSGNAFGPGLAAVPGNDPVDNCKSDAGAGKILFPVQPRKSGEKSSGVLHVETRSVVAHVKNRLRFALQEAEFDTGLIFFPGIFPGVLQQIIGR
jgi:hypothetical protein